MFGITKIWFCALLIMVAILCHHNSLSFQQHGCWRQRCLRTLSICSHSAAGETDHTQQDTSTSPENPVKTSNNLINDDADILNTFDSSLDEIDMQMILEDRRDFMLVPEGDVVDEDEDFNLVETEMDKSIAMAIKNLLNEGPKEPELSPVEKFDKIYKVSLFRIVLMS